MGNITKFFAENALKSIKESVKVANDMLQSFSFTDMGKAIDEAQSRFKSEIKRFIGQIKNYQDRYEAEIPFNPNIETISYSIEGDLLIIVIKSKDNTASTSKVVTLPEGIDPNEMAHSYDSEKHVMTFKFKKIQ